MAIPAKQEIDPLDPIREIAELGPLFLDKPLSKEAFAGLAARHPELRMEREKNGKVWIMSPVKGGSGNREAIVIFFLARWWYQKKEGKIYSSATGFELPDSAVKSPDAAWISPERLKELGPGEEEANFLRVVPDLVVEIRSQPDSLPKLKKKILEDWMAHGVRLAWLIDPYEEKTYVYRTGRKAEILQGFAGRTLSGEDVMPGLELPLDELRIAG